MDSFFSEYDLTRQQIHLLGYLVHKENHSATQKDIEKDLGFQKSTVSGFVDRLETKGFLKRVKDKNDSRINHIVLTSKSEELYEEVLQCRKKVDEKLTEGISEKEFNNLIYILNKIESNLEKMKEEQK